jgi:hypothetical protein
MVGLYWISLTPDLLSSTQHGHDRCGPFCLAVEVENDSVRFELLVRSQANLHCSCIAYATPVQRQFVLDFIDRMINEELISA